MNNVEVKTSLFLIIFSIIFLFMTLYIPQTNVSIIGSALFPQLVLIVILVLSIYNLIINIKNVEKKHVNYKNKIDFKLLGVFIGLFIITMFVINIFGFLIGSTLFMLICSYFLMFDQRDVKSFIKLLAYSAVFSFVVNYIFVNLLQLTLPAGKLFF